MAGLLDLNCETCAESQALGHDVRDVIFNLPFPVLTIWWRRYCASHATVELFQAIVPSKNSNGKNPKEVAAPLESETARMCREVAEVQLLLGESIVQMLKYHNVQLGSIIPASKDDVAGLQREGQLRELENEAIASFLTAAENGLCVSAPWLVVNAAVYLWNYTMHLGADERVQVLEGPANKLRVYIKQALTLQNESAHAERQRLVLLDCQLCRVVAEGALLNPDAKLDTVLESCDLALAALGSASYSESQGLVKVCSIRCGSRPILLLTCAPFGRLKWL